MSNPFHSRSRPAPQIPLPPGRTALISMFPLRLDEPNREQPPATRPDRSAAQQPAALQDEK
jgi:hypothetical protein